MKSGIMINHYIHLYTRISSKQPEFKGKYLRVFLWLGWLPWMIGEFLSPNSGHGRKFYLLIRGSIGCSWSLRRNPAVACGLCYWSRMFSTCNIVMTWFLHVSSYFHWNVWTEHTHQQKQASEKSTSLYSLSLLATKAAPEKVEDFQSSFRFKI